MSGGGAAGARGASPGTSSRSDDGDDADSVDAAAAAASRYVTGADAPRHKAEAESRRAHVSAAFAKGRATARVDMGAAAAAGDDGDGGQVRHTKANYYALARSKFNIGDRGVHVARLKRLLGVSMAIVYTIAILIQEAIAAEWLLASLFYLTNYPNSSVCVVIFGGGEENFEAMVWSSLLVLSAKLEVIDVWGRLLQSIWAPSMFVDSFEIAIRGGLADYSGKKGYKTSKYEVAVSSEEGEVCWVSGGFRGPQGDIRVFHEGGLDRFLLRQRGDDGEWRRLEFLSGDAAYLGDAFIEPFKKPRGGQLSDAQAQHNFALHRVREVVERVIGRARQTFTILDVRFRHRPERLEIAVAVCFEIVELVRRCEAPFFRAR